MSLKKKLGAGAAAVVIASATPFIAKWEGLETTEAEWLDKRQEIRDRYPY